MEKEFQNNGKLVCNKNILYSIVSLATKEISGVVGLSNKTFGLIGKLKNKDLNGMKIQFNPNGELVIDVFIDVYNDISAPELCFKVQEGIKNNIYNMVDVKTAVVNVHIENVVIRKEEANEGTM